MDNEMVNAWGEPLTNYEDVIEDALINGLKQKFNIEDRKALITYLFARCSILNGVDSISDDNKFTKFLLQEMCICHHNTNEGQIIKFYYEDRAVNVSCGYASVNSLCNVFYSLEDTFLGTIFFDKHGNEISAIAYVKNLTADIQKLAKQKLKPYKDSRYKNELLTLFKLQTLNEDFCIKTPVEAPSLPAFNQNESRISVDTLYERYLHAENFDTTNVHSITEAQVRDHLYLHLDLIEDGLKPIMKEYQTKEGRVDIVARDKDGSLVVIELKTENDKRLVWQCMYYPDEVKNGLRVYADDKRVRMITVAPEYPEFIKTPLDKLGYVERYTYTIKVFNNVIEEIHVDRDSTANERSEKETGLDAEIKVGLDNLIETFVYAREKLEERCRNEVEVKDLDDIALKLVEISMKRKDSYEK